MAGNAAWLFGALLGLWFVAVALRSVSFIDAVWGLSMAWLAWLSLWGTQFGPAVFLLAAMAIIWGVRLGVYLLLRFWRNGEDVRYRKMLPDPANLPAFAITALWKVFLLQGVLIMLVSSPVQVGIIAATPEQGVPALAWIGVALWLVGMIFEVVGDWQLASFKTDPANKGEVMDQGLWRYTRHPNYFGDACVWWGIWIAAMCVNPAAVIWTVPGPIFLTFTLMNWSGAALTESGMEGRYGDAFARYKERTSPFFPLPPKNSA